MNDLLKTATAELKRFLSESLPKISVEWWTKHVIDRLSFQQQKLVQERRFTALRDLDFAALLRVLDQNWFELSNSRSLPKEGRNWVKELQTVRNKWAHLSSRDVPGSETYRDADTLGRMLAMIGASAAVLSDAPGSGHQVGADESPAVESATTNLPSAFFAVGNLVTLRSNSSVVMPIVEVVAAIGVNRATESFRTPTHRELVARRLETDGGRALKHRNQHAVRIALSLSCVDGLTSRLEQAHGCP